MTLRSQEAAVIKPNFDSGNIKQNCYEITVLKTSCLTALMKHLGSL